MSNHFSNFAREIKDSRLTEIGNKKRQKVPMLPLLGRFGWVEPIGTITVYLPYMDEETKAIITDIMNSVQDFREFVIALVDRVCQVKSPDLCVYFAVHFAALLFDFKSLDRIAKDYGKLPIIRPNLFYGSSVQGRQEDLGRARNAADEVLSSKPDDWLALEMRLIKLEAENTEYPTQVFDSSTLDAIMDTLETKPEFDFTLSRVYDSLTIPAIRDGNIEKALEYNQMAIDSAESHNDLNRLAHLLRTRAGILQASDRVESQKLLHRSRDLMESMGDMAGVADILFLLSKLESIQGFYDQAIEHNLEAVSIWERIGMPTGLSSLTLSTLYNVTHNSDAGFEWAKMAENELANRPMLQPRAILNQAWSLALQHKLEEARELLDGERDPILKSGLEGNLGWLYFITSVIEEEEQDYFSAGNNVEESMDIYERSGGFVSFYICLHHRALIETKEAESAEPLGPWLSLLEEKAREENLPGILAQALFLKANINAAYGDSEEFYAIAEEAALLVNEYNLEFIRSALNRLISKDQ